MKGFKTGLVRHFRTTIISGLLLLIPVALTYLIVRFIFDVVDGVLRPWAGWMLDQFGVDWSLPGPGVVAAVVLVYLVGLLLAFRLGRAVIDRARASLLRVPFIGTIYSANRQLVESFSGTSVTGFKRVVIAQFPKERSWSLGFLTGLTDAEGVEKLIMVYVPTAPLPNSGFVVLMPPDQVLDTDLTVPDAMQLIFSGGLVSPRTVKTRPIDIAEVAKQIAELEAPVDALADRVKEGVLSAASGAGRITRLSAKKLQRASADAIRAAREGGYESGSVARDAMMGAVRAADKMGAKSASHVKDAITGVTHGVKDATGITTKVIHEGVSGAIRAAKGFGFHQDAARGAAEGAIRAAAGLGVTPDQAVTEVARGSMEAIKENSKEVLVVAKETIKGVIAGIDEENGDVPNAARRSAHELMIGGIRAGADPETLANELVSAANEVCEELSLGADAIVDATIIGAIEGTNEVDEEAGKRVSSGLRPSAALSSPGC